MAFDYSVKFKAIDKISATVDKINSKMAQMNNKASAISSNISNSIKKGTQKGARHLNKLHNKMRQMGKEPIDFGVSFGSLLAMGATLGVPISRAIEFEKSFAGVKKVVTGTDEEVAKLKKQIIDMTAVVPKTASDISAIVESGAKMGIAINKLPQYTMIVAKASVAFDMSAEQTGEAFGKISNQLGLTIPQLEIFGDKVNHLADNTASSAKGIIEITKRTAGVMSSLKFDTGTIVGISAFADQMSVSSEVGATAMNNILNKIRATEEGSRLLKEKGGFALIDIANKFKKLDGVARSEALRKLFGEGEGSRMFEKLINQTDVLKKSLDFALSESTLGSMSREFANVSDTTANKMVLMRNSLDRLAIGIGDALLPSIKEMVENVAPMIDKITTWAGENKSLIMTVAKIVAVGATLTTGFLALKFAMTPLLILFKAYSVITTIMTAKQMTFNAVLLANPIGLIVAGVVALIAVLIGLYVYWDDIKKIAVSAFDSMKDGFLALMSPIQFVIDLLDSFMSKFDIYNEAKDKIGDIAGAVEDNVADAFESTKNFFGFGDDKTTETPIDNINKNHTVVDVNVKAIGAIVTDQKATSTASRVKLDTANNGV